MDLKFNVSEEHFKGIIARCFNIKKEIKCYILIQDKFNDNCIDGEFIKNYKWFYKLDNAGLGEKIKEKNFELIKRRVTDLEQILSEIYDIPTIQGFHTVQLSFATKIIHTIDNNEPIFDANVAKLLKLNKVIPSSNNKEARIESAKSVYDELIAMTDNIITSTEGKKLISYFYKLDIPDIEKVPKVKALDFCLWLLGA